MKFSKIEIKEIVKAWLAVSLIFGIAFVGVNAKLLVAIPIALITAGIAFVLHEMAHKYVAQKYRCWAEFRAHNTALIIGVIISFFGFVLLAPGGVFIRGATKEQHGRIALAGPATNIILAGIFYGLTFIPVTQLLTLIIQYSFRINALLAVFNLIPFQPFDGGAVFRWNKLVWGLGVALAIVLMVVPMGVQ